MNRIDCDAFRQDIEAYVLNALEERDCRRMEAHLETCADCAQVARAYQATVDHLSLGVPLYRAPRRLRDVVMGGAGGLRPRFGIGPLRGAGWWSAAAAVFLAVAIGGMTWAVMLSNRVHELQDKNGKLAELSQLDSAQRAALLRLQSDLNSTKTQQKQMASTLEEQSTLIVLALDPDLVPTELEGTSMAPTASCRYVWSTKQTLGALTCRGLPSLSAVLTYEFWAVKGEKTVNLGGFSPRGDGSASLLVKPMPETPGAPTLMWVTLELATGVVSKPSTQVVLHQAPSQQASR